jgi:hypothetical protein
VNVLKDAQLDDAGVLQFRIWPFGDPRLTNISRLEWLNISKSLIQHVEYFQAQREKQQNLRVIKEQELKIEATWRQQFLASSTLNCQAFPPLATFKNLASVRPFLAQTIIPNFDTTWTSALPVVQSDIAEVRRSKKVVYARPLAAMLAKTGRPLPLSFTEPLQLQGFPSFRVQFDRIRLHDSSTVSEAQLDELLSRFTSRAFWSCTGQGEHRVGSFVENNIHRQRNPSHPSGATVSSRTLDILFELLRHTGVEDGPADEVAAKLETLGAVFGCRWKNCSSKPVGMNFSQLVSASFTFLTESRAA